jgi:hypothetical protein
MKPVKHFMDAQPRQPSGVESGWKEEVLMKITHKYFTTILLSFALANGGPCFQPACRGAEQPPVNLAERIRVLGAEDAGLVPIDKAPTLSFSILNETSRAGLALMTTSKVSSRTNQFFAELQQNLILEATEPQLLDFLRNVAATNSALRVQSLLVLPTPDRSRLRVTMGIAGEYRLPRTGQPPDAEQTEYLVLSQRRHLRQAALDCYNLTKATLPAGWQLDGLKFQDGKQLSAEGQAPPGQVPLLEEVRAKLEKAQGSDGKPLFSSGQATMRTVRPGLTNFWWSMEFELSPPESR